MTNFRPKYIVEILQSAFDRACKRFGIGPTPGAGEEPAQAVRDAVAHDDVPAALKLQGATTTNS
ncbi:UNVERIFIED_CONTAM: hypothetical protein ABIE34_004148 [Jeotgalibacillus campisalis]